MSTLLTHFCTDFAAAVRFAKTTAGSPPDRLPDELQSAASATLADGAYDTAEAKRWRAELAEALCALEGLDPIGPGRTGTPRCGFRLPAVSATHEGR